MSTIALTIPVRTIANHSLHIGHSKTGGRVDKGGCLQSLVEICNDLESSRPLRRL